MHVVIVCGQQGEGALCAGGDESDDESEGENEESKEGGRCVHVGCRLAVHAVEGSDVLARSEDVDGDADDEAGNGGQPRIAVAHKRRSPPGVTTTYHAALLSDCPFLARENRNTAATATTKQTVCAIDCRPRDPLLAGRGCVRADGGPTEVVITQTQLRM